MKENYIKVLMVKPMEHPKVVTIPNNITTFNRLVTSLYISILVDFLLFFCPHYVLIFLKATRFSVQTNVHLCLRH